MCWGLNSYLGFYVHLFHRMLISLLNCRVVEASFAIQGGSLGCGYWHWVGAVLRLSGGHVFGGTLRYKMRFALVADSSRVFVTTDLVRFGAPRDNCGSLIALACWGPSAQASNVRTSHSPCTEHFSTTRHFRATTHYNAYWTLLTTAPSEASARR